MIGIIALALISGGIIAYVVLVLANKSRREEIKYLRANLESAEEDNKCLEELMEWENEILTEKTKIIERLADLVEYHKKCSSFLRASNKKIRSQGRKFRFIQLERAYKL